MTSTPFDGALAGFRHLDTVTLTVYAVAPTYLPDTAHIDLTDIDPGDLLGSDTSEATLVESAGLAKIAVDPVSIDISAAEAVGWLVWVDDADKLVCYDAGPAGTPDDPLEPDYTAGLLTSERP